MVQQEASQSTEPAASGSRSRGGEALAPDSSPGEVSRLAGQLQGLALAEGTAAGWCVALKPPKSVQLVVLDCAAGGQWAETTVDAWLQRLLLNQVGWSEMEQGKQQQPGGPTGAFPPAAVVSWCTSTCCCCEPHRPRYPLAADSRAAQITTPAAGLDRLGVLQ